MKYPTAVLALLVICGAFGVDAATGPKSPQPEQSTHADETQFINPAIEDYGKVVNLPDAAHQPRAGSQIVVDVTKGGDRDQLNTAIEKVCRYVNIYAGAGKETAKVEIAVVLHDDATLAALSDNAYAARFGTEGNPNLDCLSAQKGASVKVCVCGQSLINKGEKPSEVSPQADVAVSALTALVNLQADGYSYVPMLK